MAENYLVVDDRIDRAERLRDAIDQLEARSDEPPTMTHVGSTARLARMTPENLATFDRILVDFNLSGELKETVSPVLSMRCAGSVRQVEMRTGIGVMLWLRTVLDSTGYAMARGNRTRVQVYGFTNPNDGPRFRLFAAAALDWFGAVPFQPAEEREVLADYLSDPSLIEEDPIVWECQDMLAPFRRLMDVVSEAESENAGSWRHLGETIEWMEIIRRGQRAGGTAHDYEIAFVHYTSADGVPHEGGPWNTAGWQQRADRLWAELRVFFAAVGGADGLQWTDLEAALEVTSNFWSAPDVAAAMFDHRHRSAR